MDSAVREKALDTIANMKAMVSRGALQHVGYNSEVVNEKLAEQGAICQGKQYCLLGTTWVAHGDARFYNTSFSGNGGYLAGVTEGRRKPYLNRRPALRLVYDTLNEIAERRMKRLGYDWPENMSKPNDYPYGPEKSQFEESAAEAYFEEILNTRTDEQMRRAAHSLFNEARDKIAAL